MNYNGKEVKNLKEYVEAVAGRPLTKDTLDYPEQFTNIVLDYYSNTNEYTNEDLHYIESVDPELYFELGMFVDHWELQQFSDPTGEIISCNDYFSYSEILKDYEEEVAKDGYWRILPVYAEGYPNDFSEDYRANF